MAPIICCALSNKILRGHLEAIFNCEYAKKEKLAVLSRYLCEKGHEHIDETHLKTLPTSLIDEQIENPNQGINTIVKYTKTRTYLINGKKTTASNRYYICSLVFPNKTSTKYYICFWIIGL